MSEQETTIVIFRKWPSRNGGDVIALFPYEKSDFEGRYCMSYERIGQHGGADFHGVVNVTKLATPAEYADLKAELERIGYKLIMRKRVNWKRNK